MSFKIYIYYCALFGGWAALVAWGLTYGLGVRGINNALVTSTIIGGAIGLFVAMAIGALDALLNSVGFQRVIRVGVCMVVGLLGGFAGGALGQILASFLPSFVGWAIAGLFIGVSIGVYDLM